LEIDKESPSGQPCALGNLGAKSSQDHATDVMVKRRSDEHCASDSLSQMNSWQIGFNYPMTLIAQSIPTTFAAGRSMNSAARH